MQSSLIAALAVASLAQARSSSNSSASLETDINKIQRYWGQISPYADNAESIFGVEDVGLPDGCAIEQAHLLQRHANRGPTSYFDDGINDDRFAQKLADWNGSEPFTGPLSFLNTYTYLLNDDGYLNNLGAQTEFAAGASFWNRYGRLLFDAVPGQLAYNASYSNGTARPKPVLRTTSQSRMRNTEINWALGFFGPSFQVVPDPTLANATSAFDVLVIPEGGSENNTLAAYDSCFGDYVYDVGYMGDLDLTTYIPKYLAAATERLSQYVPASFNLTANDTYAMQSICAYEATSIGESQFCGFFTLDEWDGFELTLDTEYYYDYSWGQPTGRAQGIGYLQELLARLQNEYINVSNTSVNSTLTDNPTTFPLGREFYADFSHDDIIISVLTAMSLDYFKDAPNYTQYPPDPDRKFKVSEMTPFGARLVTEVIGCSSPSPAVSPYHSTIYSRSANGYNAANATYKFIRQRLNNAILPLDSIRGGLCSGRSDGLCPLTDFIQSQSNNTNLSNYQYACFGNYTIDYDEAIEGIDWDGTIFP